MKDTSKHDGVRAGAAGEGGSELADRLPKRRTPAGLYIALAVMFGIICFGGYSYYRDEVGHLKQQRIDELLAVADMKVDQVLKWREERISDARFYLFNQPFHGSVRRFLFSDAKASGEEEIRKTLTPMWKNHDYAAIVLVDTANVVRLVIGAAILPSSEHVNGIVAACRRERTVLMQSFVRDSVTGIIHLDTAVPLLDVRGRDTVCVGALLFQIDPYRLLFPMVQSWPTPSRTSEVLICRREGDSVLYLSELRLEPRKAMTLRLPLSRTQLTTVQAITKGEAVLEGEDYRGVPVIAAYRPIPATGEYLIAKLDRDEIFREIHERGVYLLVMLLLVVLLFVLVLIGVIRWERLGYYKDRLDVELERKALLEHFESLVQYAYDAIVLFDSEGRIVEANTRAAEMYGYAPVEFGNLTIDHLRRLPDPSAFRERFNLALANGGNIFESLHRRRDGTSFPVEVSSRILESGGRRYLQTIIRDISARKAAQEQLHAAKEQLETIIEASPAAIITIDTAQNVQLWNKAAERIFGWTKEEVLGKPPPYIPEDAREESRRITEQILQGDPVNEQEMGRVRKDGTAVLVHTSLVLLKDASGKVRGVLGILNDVTLQRQAERRVAHLNRLYTVLSRFNQAIVRLRDREAILQEACAIAADAGSFDMTWIGIADGEGGVVRLAAWSGKPSNYLQRILLHMNTPGAAETAASAALAAGTAMVCNDIEAEEMSAAIRAAGLQEGFRSKAAFPLKIQGKTIGVFCFYSTEAGYFTGQETALLEEVSEDVSLGLEMVAREEERRRVDEALRQSEEQFRKLFENAPLGILIHRGGTIIGINSTSLRMHGYDSAGELVGTSVVDMVSPESRIDIEERIRRRKNGEDFETTYETIARRKNGTVFPARLDIAPIVLRDGLAYLTYITDITEQKRRAEELLERSTVFENAHDAIISLALNGVIKSWNRGAEDLYGWVRGEVASRMLQEIVPNDNGALIGDILGMVLRDGEWKGELTQHDRGGRTVIVLSSWTLIRSVSGDAAGIVVINADITAMKKLEAQVLRSQRLESLGTLAGGIAHDLNNVLAPILLSAEALQPHVTDAYPARLVETIRKSVQRGAEVIRQVLTFARGLKGEHVTILPNVLMRDLHQLIHETFPKSIQVIEEIPEGLWQLRGDETQIHQVLLNLCVNARDAMPGGGTLHLTVRNVVLSADDARKEIDAKPGFYVRFDVIDTGVGIPSHLTDKIFEPFFTTKEPGKGTGLGLSTAITIVKSHGGFLSLVSKPGSGTTFSIFLPAAQTTEERAVAQESSGSIAGHGEWILLVDDEDSIRSITTDILETNGYTVLTAKDGARGLVLFSENRDRLAVVITDIMMPVMDGVALIRSIREVKAEMPIIAISGLQTENRAAEMQKLGVSAFLTKPFNSNALLQTLRSVFSPSA